jgi:queuine/archaeosine tRNA-ribosyltransferase
MDAPTEHITYHRGGNQIRDYPPFFINTFMSFKNYYLTESINYLLFNLIVEDVDRAKEIFSTHQKLLQVDPKKLNMQHAQKIQQALNTALANINKEVSSEAQTSSKSEETANKTYQRIQSFLQQIGDYNHPFADKLRLFLSKKLKEIETIKGFDARMVQRGKEAGRVGTIVPANPALRTSAGGSARASLKRKTTFGR